MNRTYTTAKTRKKMSVPLRWLLKEKLIKKEDMILDYGCGKGDDVRFLREEQYPVIGYDPYYHRSKLDTTFKFDIILSTYVLNVVEEKEEKEIITFLKTMLNKNGRFFLTVRRDLKESRIEYKGYIQRMSHPKLYSIYKNKSFEIYSNIQ